MDSGGMPDSWTPPEPPVIGSSRWKDDMAFKFMTEAFNGLPDYSGIFELPKVLAGGKEYHLGYYAIFKDSYGTNYFRRNSIEPVPVVPIFDGKREFDER